MKKIKKLVVLFSLTLGGVSGLEIRDLPASQFLGISLAVAQMPAPARRPSPRPPARPAEPAATAAPAGTTARDPNCDAVVGADEARTPPAAPAAPTTTPRGGAAPVAGDTPAPAAPTPQAPPAAAPTQLQVPAPTR